MTARAEIVAAELARRGWGISDELTKQCQVCRAELEREHNYCPMCGTKRDIDSRADTLEDLEAALALVMP